MNYKGTSVFENSLIWFGAAVSIAEIVTGTYFAPLGFKRGLLAILLGHFIGCFLLYLAGLIGGKMRKSAMETTKMSFGSKGALLFTGLNIFQLIGWTAIMIYDGALAANHVFDLGNWIWCLLIGFLIILWIFMGIQNIARVNMVAMTGLFVLTLILSFLIFNNNHMLEASTGALSFGAAVELSIAMPLSWLPLISDYTREAQKPAKATLASAVTYGIVSSWMYIMGMGAALFTAESDIAQIMVKAGLGAAGLMIIVFSTVTTTFLDAYSAGISSKTLSNKINGKSFAIIVTVMGILGAIFLPLHDMTDFLYFIGSVFAPMVAILIADFFILKKNKEKDAYNLQNLLIWLWGFVIYRWLMTVDIVIGNTLPDMAITILLSILADKLRKKQGFIFKENQNQIRHFDKDVDGEIQGHI